MRQLPRHAAYAFILLFTAFLLSSCMGGSYTTSSTCRGGGGWYSKDKNLGKKNKPVHYGRSSGLVRR